MCTPSWRCITSTNVNLPFGFGAAFDGGCFFAICFGSDSGSGSVALSSPFSGSDGAFVSDWDSPSSSSSTSCFRDGPAKSIYSNNMNNDCTSLILFWSCASSKFRFICLPFALATGLVDGFCGTCSESVSSPVSSTSSRSDCGSFSDSSSSDSCSRPRGLPI